MAVRKEMRYDEMITHRIRYPHSQVSMTLIKVLA